MERHRCDLAEGRRNRRIGHDAGSGPEHCDDCQEPRRPQPHPADLGPRPDRRIKKGGLGRHIDDPKPPISQAGLIACRFSRPFGCRGGA